MQLGLIGFGRLGKLLTKYLAQDFELFVYDKLCTLLDDNRNFPRSEQNLNILDVTGQFCKVHPLRINETLILSRKLKNKFGNPYHKMTKLVKSPSHVKV